MIAFPVHAPDLKGPGEIFKHQGIAPQIISHQASLPLPSSPLPYSPLSSLFPQ